MGFCRLILLLVYGKLAVPNVVVQVGRVFEIFAEWFADYFIEVLAVGFVFLNFYIIF